MSNAQDELVATWWARTVADTRFWPCAQKQRLGQKIAVFRVSRLGIDMEGSLLRLKSFIPCREKLPFEYGQISTFVFATSGKSPLDMATGTLTAFCNEMSATRAADRSAWRPCRCAPGVRTYLLGRWGGSNTKDELISTTPAQMRACDS